MAEIIHLPTAAREQVSQPPRRGRLPKTVGSLREAIYRRYKSEIERKWVLLKQADEHRADVRTLLSELLNMNASAELDGLMVVISRPGKTPMMCAAGMYRADLSTAIAATHDLRNRLEHLAKREAADGKS